MGPNLIDWGSYKNRSGHRHTEREGQREKVASPSQGERPQRKPTLPTPWPETCSLQGCEEISFCWVTYSVVLCMAVLANSCTLQLYVSKRYLLCYFMDHLKGLIKQWSAHLNCALKKIRLGSNFPQMLGFLLIWMNSALLEWKHCWLRLMFPGLQLSTMHWYLMLAHSKNW